MSHGQLALKARLSWIWDADWTPKLVLYPIANATYELPICWTQLLPLWQSVGWNLPLDPLCSSSRVSISSILLPIIVLAEKSWQIWHVFGCVKHCRSRIRKAVFVSQPGQLCPEPKSTQMPIQLLRNAGWSSFHCLSPTILRHRQVLTIVSNY